ncbi:BrnA antitoxin family protein [Brasilonema sp. CT11]|nr:BrnA antitoxin family protein [Brasilonema sp. CT11]
MSKTNFSADMSPEERHRKLVEMSDEEIDYSDIAPLDEDFWKNAELSLPQKKEGIYIKLNPRTLQWFRSRGKGYQAMIDSVLTSYVEHQEKLGVKSQE